MKRFALLLTLSCLLMGCEFLTGINTDYIPEQERGVVDGVNLGPRKVSELQKHGIIIADTREGTIIILPADRLFAETIDRVTINPDFQPALNEMIHILQGYPKVSISIVGHTDGVMTPDLEKTKSSQYAYAVSNYLTSAGLSPTRIKSVRGASSTQRIDKNENLEARHINRRVEIITSAPLR